jgi:hypothetical protein
MVKSVPVVFLKRPGPVGEVRPACFDRSRKWGLGFICVSGILFEALIVIARYILAVFSRSVLSHSRILAAFFGIVVLSHSRILAFSQRSLVVFSRILAFSHSCSVLSHYRPLAVFSRLSLALGGIT